MNVLLLTTFLVVAVLVTTLTTPTTVDAFANGLGKRPPLGHSTWCTDDGICGLLFEKCSAAEVMKQIDALVDSGLHALGYDVELLDDCWSAATRDANGNLQPDAKRFPNGMEPVVQYAHSKGVKLGVYTCIGTKTCKHNLPGSFGHYKEDSETLAKWDIDYVKIDNCAKPSQYSEHELYANFSYWLNKSSVELRGGKSVYIALCEWGAQDVVKWGGSVANQYRIQMDHLPLFYCPSPLCRAAGTGFGQGTWQIIEYAATLAPRNWSGANTATHGFGDPDFAMTLYGIDIFGKDILNTMDFTESQTELSFWALWSSPILVATQMANMTQQKKSLLSNAGMIATQQDPAGIPGYRVFNRSDGSQLWLKVVQNSSEAVAIIYNSNVWTKESLKVTVNWLSDAANDLNPSLTGLLGEDVWSGNSAKTQLLPSHTVTLKPRQVQMLRLSCFVGSNPANCFRF